MSNSTPSRSERTLLKCNPLTLAIEVDEFKTMNSMLVIMDRLSNNDKVKSRDHGDLFTTYYDLVIVALEYNARRCVEHLSGMLFKTEPRPKNALDGEESEEHVLLRIGFVNGVEWCLKYTNDGGSLFRCMLKAYDSRKRIFPTPLLCMCAKSRSANGLDFARILVEEFKEPVDEVDAYGNTALLDAAESRNRDVLNYLIQQGADTLRTNGYGSNILHILADFDHDENEQDVRAHNKWICGVVERLVADKKVDPTARDKHGRTPLGICREDKNRYLKTILRNAVAASTRDKRA